MCSPDHCQGAPTSGSGASVGASLLAAGEGDSLASGAELWVDSELPPEPPPGLPPVPPPEVPSWWWCPDADAEALAVVVGSDDGASVVPEAPSVGVADAVALSLDDADDADGEDAEDVADGDRGPIVGWSRTVTGPVSGPPAAMPRFIRRTAPSPITTVAKTANAAAVRRVESSVDMRGTSEWAVRTAGV